MLAAKQKEAAKENIKKAQRTWKNMTPRQRAIAQPEGRQEQSLELKVKENISG